jgi:hypothetical protein
MPIRQTFRVADGLIVGNTQVRVTEDSCAY